MRRVSIIVCALVGLALALPDHEPFVRVARMEMHAPWVRPTSCGYVLGALALGEPEVWVDRLAFSETPAPQQEDAADTRAPMVGFSELSVKKLYAHATISERPKRIGPIDVAVAGTGGATLGVRISAVIDPALPPLEVTGSLVDPLSDARSASPLRDQA